MAFIASVQLLPGTGEKNSIGMDLFTCRSANLRRGLDRQNT